MSLDLDELIAGAKAHFESIEPVDQDVALGDRVVTVRLRPMLGTAWRELLVKCPPRPGVIADRNMGYNVDLLVPQYPHVSLVGDDGEVPVGDKWSDIVGVLSGPDLTNVAFAIWGLNEWDPAQRALGKAQRGES